MPEALPAMANLATAPIGVDLRGLAAGVRVDLGVEDEDVHVPALRQDVVEAAVADVVRPAVAADDPEALLDEVVGDVEEAAGREALLAGELRLEGGDALALVGDPLLGPLVGRQEAGDELVAEEAAQLLDELGGVLGLLVEGEAHAEAELGVVLEEGVRPGRAAPVAVDGVGRRREVAAVDRRAAGGVGDQHPVAEELRHQLDVRGLAAAEAGAGELEEGLHELGALHVDLQLRPVGLGEVEEELEVLALGLAERHLRGHVEGLVPRVPLVLGGADDRAEVAARAVLGGDLDRVLHPLELGGPVVDRLVGRRGRREERGLEDLGADRRVRADHRALVALDAELLVPDRDLEGDVPLLPLRRRRGEGAVDREGRDGEEVALVGEHERR